jgi:WD40 repeat protein
MDKLITFRTKIGFVFILLIITCFSEIYGQSIETVVQTGHYGNVTAVCYSKDGKFIATGSLDKVVKLWRSTDGKEILTFLGSTSGILNLEFNNAGTQLLAVNKDGVVLIWNVSTGQLINQLKIEEDKITCASFNPNGLLVVTGSKESHVAIWDIIKGEQIRVLKAQPVDLIMEKQFGFAETGSVTYSRDGKYIVTGNGNFTTILWDAETGKEMRKYWETFHVCTACVNNSLISPDNKYIISSFSDSIKIFDRINGKLVNSLSGNADFTSVTISSDARFAAAIKHRKVFVWDLSTKKVVFQTRDELNGILAVAFSPDGKKIITGNENRMADVWHIAAGKKLMTLKGYLNQVDERLINNSYAYWAGLVNETRLSPDGRFIAIGRTGNNAKLVDFKTGKIEKTLRGHSGMVISLNFSNDGKYLATGGLDGKAIVWDVNSGEMLKKFIYKDTNQVIFSVDISPDNHTLAAADWRGNIVLWDIETGNRIKILSPEKNFSSFHIKYTANGLYIISAGADKILKLIEVDSGEEIKTFVGHTGFITSINLGSGNKIITTSMDQTIRVWDLFSGLQITKIKAHQGGVFSAKFDTTGKYIVSGGDDNKVKLWNSQTGALVTEFSGHRGCVGDVNITTDNKYIISGSRDGSVRIWNVAQKRELVSMVFLNSDDWFIKDPEGYFDASEGAYGSISFVKGTEIYSINQFFNVFYKPGLYSEAFSGGKAGFRQNMMKSIETYPPPQVQIISPEQGTNEENNLVTVLVKVTNSGGGVKELKVMHNGKRQIVDDSDVKRVKKEGQYITKTFDVELVPGENDIAVSAFSDGEIECEPATLSLSYKGLQKLSDCYLLSIGINKYENEDLNLRYAKPDAQAVADLINDKGKGLFNKMHIFKLLDKDATKQNIFAKLDEISKSIKKEDVFIFFYAGHGSVVDNYFYFITTENTGLYQEEKLKNAIQVKELQEKFKIIPALKQVVFIDACHSGSSIDVLALRGATEEKALAQLSRSSGIHVMASSESQQQAAEIQSLGHGVFTYVLLEALNGKADGSPKDSKITVYELKSYIDDQVPEVSYRLIRHKQFPGTFSIGHDFPVVLAN